MLKPKFIGLVAGLGLIIPVLAGVPALAVTSTTTTTISVIPPGPITQGDAVTVTAMVTVTDVSNPHTAEGDTVNFLTSSGACNGGTFGAVGAGIISSGDATLAPVLDTSTAGVICIRAVYPFTDKVGNHENQTSQDEVTLVIEAALADISVAKGNVMGPYDDEGDLDGDAEFAVSAGFGGDVVDGDVHVNESGPDAGGIWIGLDDTQRYKFEITITNNGGTEANGAKITDVIPAEYDLDPGLHEDDSVGVIDGTCNDACDGDDDAFPGYVSDKPVKCMVTHSQPDSADRTDPPPPPKQPEFLTIMLDGLGNGESCIVTVYVKTDMNPGGGESPDYEPTSCRVIALAAEHDDVDVDIYDTITLNEGLKVFDPSNGERLSGPAGSLQLTCNIPD